MMGPPSSFCGSAIVELRSYRFEPFAGNAIGIPRTTPNEPSALEPGKHRQCAVGQAKAVAIEAVDDFNFAARVADEFNPSALRQRVQYALFVF